MTADLLDRITINPDQCSGRPCVRGMRIRVIDVLSMLAAGQSREEILAEYPYLVPAVVAGDEVTLKTIIPSRRATRTYLRDEE